MPDAVVPSHHVPDELLLDYASGRVGEAAALVIATHLALCPFCRLSVQALESLGGDMLEDAPVVAPDSKMLPSLLARLDAAGPVREPPEEPRAGDLPRPLQRYLRAPGHALDWRPLLPGLKEVRLPIRQKGGRASLLLARPGRGLPYHTHLGTEMTLVLSGCFSDAYGRFQRGDVAIVDGSVDHRPIADSGEECLCLVVTDAPLKLTGPFGRHFNRFIRF